MRSERNYEFGENMHNLLDVCDSLNIKYLHLPAHMFGKMLNEMTEDVEGWEDMSCEMYASIKLRWLKNNKKKTCAVDDLGRINDNCYEYHYDFKKQYEEIKHKY